MPAPVPEIPATTSLDQQFARIYTPIKETLDIYEGRVGDPTVDRVVKIGELAEILTSDAIINAIIAEIGGGLDPNDFLRVDGTNSMTGTLSIVTADDPKIDARDAAGDEVLARFRNTDTGFTSTDGLEVGILGTEVARVWNYEATDLEIGTNNLLAILADSAGGLELYYAGAKKAETVTGGFSVTGDVTATGDISATQIQGVDVQNVAPADGEVLAYVAANSRYEPSPQTGGGAGGPTTGAIVYRNSTQSITPVSTWIALSWNTEVRDDENYWAIGNPTRITFPEDGYYTVSAVFNLSSATSTLIFSRFLKNGTDVISINIDDIFNTNADARLSTVTHYFEAGDYLEFQLNMSNVETVQAATAANLSNNACYVTKHVVAGINAAFSSGVQKIRTSWVSATQIKFDKGVIDIQGTLYELPAQITITPTVAASSNYIVYVTAPGSGTTLTATEFSVSTTQPTEDLPNRAWMNGNDRAICAFRTDGSANIEWFEMTGQHYTSGDQYSVYNAVLGTGWTTMTLTREPDWVRQVEMTFRVPIFVANANVNWRPTGVTTTSIIAVSLNTSGRVPFNTIIIGVDSNLQFEAQATVGGNTVTLQPKGWVVPHSIYNG